MPRKTVDVTAPGELLGAVLELCTGRLGWKEVAATLASRWSADLVEDFLASLSSEGVLVEAGEALANWRDIGDFPALFPRLVSAQEAKQLPCLAHKRLLPGKGIAASATEPPVRALTDLLQSRESHRTFADTSLTIESLARILWAAHGVTRPAADEKVGWHRTVGSGGNMHSARWFVAVLRDLPSTDCSGVAGQIGLYEARFHVEGGVTLERMGSQVDEVWRVLLDPRPLRFASAVLLPVYDVSIPARKYSNRATVFAHIEAGQSLQNAQLMAVAVGAACVVRGDTCANALLDLVGRCCVDPPARPSHWLAMPCLVLGAKPSAQDAARQLRGNWIKVGPIAAGPALKAGSASHQYAFFAGPVQVGSSQVFTSGRATDPRSAVTKAEAEAWERRGWAELGATVEGTMGAVEGSLDPRPFVAYTATQYAHPAFPCTPFSRQRKYLWVSGVDAQTGSMVKLPAECVHAITSLPIGFQRKAYTSSNTSGVAAWTDTEGALCRGTLELIERDAFLRCWIADKAPVRIARSGLPQVARERIESLECAGFVVTVCQLASTFASVVSVFVQKAEAPFTAITAAAAFDAECALAKAMDEAEGRATQAVHFPAEPLRRLCDVESLEDINRIYQSPLHFRRADFYANGPISPVLGKTGAACTNWNSLKSHLDAAGHRLFAFDLTPDGASVDQGRVPLRVIRALATGLLPIWFHHALAPKGLPAFASAAGGRRGGRTTRASFIHPFT